MRHVLVVAEGTDAGRELELDRDEMLVGRGVTCHLVLDSAAVSRRHARLVREGDTYTIEDLGSRYHTFVNDQRITEKVRLADGDLVRIADTQFVFRARRPEVCEQEDDARLAVLKSIDACGGTRLIFEVGAQAKLEAMLRITQALGRTLDLDAVLDRMLDGLFEIFPHADRGLVLLREGERLVPKAAKHRRPADDSIPYSRTIVRQAMDRRQAILSEDAVVDERFTQAQSIAALRIRSMMCVPLLSQEMAPLGVIQLDTQRPEWKFSADDVQLLTSVAAQASISVEYAQLHRESLKRARLEREMDIARDVQRNFLPRATPELQGYEFWAYYLAAGKVGGDYYDFVRLPDGRQAVLLGDVSGKGVPAALMMAKASALCKVALLSHPRDLARALGEINNEICLSSTAGSFLTLVVCVIDPCTHQMTIASAGHMSPVFRRPDGSVVQPPEGDVAGLPLGIVRDFSYGTITVPLAEDELVVLYSDGISEAANAGDELYSDERIVELLRRSGGTTAAEIGRDLLDDVRRHSAGCEQSDDVSLVLFRRVGV